jgi:predicted DNA-binding transcriptional regulator YafY
MAEAVALAIPFKRPPRFNLAEHWKSSTAQFGQKQERYPATLALAPEAAASLSAWYPLSPAKKLPHGVKFPVGWAVFDVQFEGQSHAQFMVMGFGPRARVLAPAELRERVQADILAAASAD